MTHKVNDKSQESVLPEWLDARTLTFLAAFVALGALIQTSFSDMRDDITTMRGEMHQMGKDINARIDGVREQLRADVMSLRVELRADIGELDDRLRAVETDVAAIRAGMVRFDARVRAVEQHARDAIDATAVDGPGG